MTDAYDRLIGAHRDAQRGEFAPAKAQLRVQVERVESDDMGNPLIAHGKEEGAGTGSAVYPVHIFGRAQVEAGEVILGEYDKHSPAAPVITYAGHIASTLAGAGAARLAPGPTPAFVAGSGWFSTSVDPTIGAVASFVSIYFLTVPAKYRPSGYVVSYRMNAGDWADVAVPGQDVPTLQVRLPRSFPAGATVDVKLRATYAVSYAPSLESVVKSLVTAADTASPGTATGLTVDTTIAGRLLLRASGTLDLNRFDSWRYEVATSAGGAGLTTTQLPGEFEFIGSPGTYYVAVRPVSKSGVLGTRYPGPTAFSGPYTVTAAADPPDTTAPPQWGAPTLAARVNTPNGGGGQGFLKVTFPAYAYPADYAYTVVRLVSSSADLEQFIIYKGTANAPQEFQVDFASWTVTLYGVDKAENRSIVSPSAVLSVSDPGLPAAAGDVTTASVSLGVRVVWSTVVRGLWYRVWRATSAAGAGAAVIADRVDADRYIDSQAASGLSAGTVYYYKVEARNEGGGGTLSPNWIAGTVGAYDGANAAANTFEANVLKATTTVTSLLRTGVSPNTRWELEGATGGAGQFQFRGYENVAGVEKKRVQIDGTGFTVFGDAVQSDIRMNRNSVGRGQLVAHGVTVGHDGTNPYINVDLNSNGQLRFTGPSSNGYIEQGSHGAVNALWLRKTLGTIGDPVLVLYDNAGGGAGLEKLALSYDGLGVRSNAFSGEATWKYVPSVNRWQTGQGIQVGALCKFVLEQEMGGGYNTYPYQHYATGTLGGTAGNSNAIATEAILSGGGSIFQQRHYAFRAQTNSFWFDARWRTDAVGDYATVGGGIDIGFRSGSNPYVAMHANGAAVLYWDQPNNRMEIPNGLHITGALSKGSGSFVIPDPTPGYEGYELRHCFNESPTAGENSYSYKVSFGPKGGRLAVEGPDGEAVEAAITDLGPGNVARWSVTFALPDYWPHLNRRPRLLACNSGDGWGRVKARISEDRTTLTVLAEEGGEYTVLLTGVRQDPEAKRWWDRRGIRKTKGQRWTNEATVERREARLAHKARRDSGAVVAPLTARPPYTLYPQEDPHGAQPALDAGV